MCYTPKMSSLMQIVIVSWVWVGVVLVISVVMMGVPEGQSTPPCAQKLVPCEDYVNSTKPPASCCEPLREAVTQELDCLCDLYNTPAFLPSIGININLTDMLSLPASCGIPVDISACVNATDPTSPWLTPAGSNRSLLKIIGGIISVVTGLMLISVLLIWRKEKTNDPNMNNQNVELVFGNYGSQVPKRYNLLETSCEN
ncbi:non-specific lipid transfer protein GPI-anchored 9-like [Cornus florida]|uniref:non-specific lipid transfer protein GPI-anchored 9-like n=1 Tax=Cornus florida TaxID=4283 RepID=UPI0028991196|nr:non-specific lipid transfer protein GPI-anchored 9-like [Cornus florida]